MSLCFGGAGFLLLFLVFHAGPTTVDFCHSEITNIEIPR